MPTIRDGRGILTEHDMAPRPGEGSGPVERGIARTPAPPAELPPAPRRREQPELVAESRRRGAAAHVAVLAAKTAEAGGGSGKRVMSGWTPEARARQGQAARAKWAAKRAAKTARNGTGNIPPPESPPADPVPEPARLARGVPCPSCSHAPVCSIKPALDAWLAKVALPASPHPAIHISCEGVDVSCQHYLAAK
jgi:hypothetical protein